MTNKQFLKTIKTTAVAVALSMVFCESARAGAGVITCPDNVPTGTKCYKCGDNCTAKLETTGKMTISGTGDMYDYTYNEGSSIGAKYTTYAPWRDAAQNIRSIEIYGVSSVGQAAFLGMKNATSVYIDDSVKNIKIWSLEDCNFTKVYIPASVKSIGDNALKLNPNLEIVAVAETTQLSSGINASVHSNLLYTYKTKGDLVYLYNSENNVADIYEDLSDLQSKLQGTGNSRYELDDKGNIII